MTISDYYSLSQSAQSHRECDKIQSRVLTNNKTQVLSVSAVNITFTKIVTYPAKSVKNGVEMGAGNELFWNQAINMSYNYPKLLLI
jgi:hypothetical protein